MTHAYTLINVTKSPRGAIKAQLAENGSVIAEVRRPAPGRLILPYEVTKFYSDRARCRFDDFCNCLSMGETIEAISGL